MFNNVDSGILIPPTTPMPVNSNSKLVSKDKRWLEIEVCREQLRGTCERGDNCKFAHPPKHMDLIPGQKVTVCYDSMRDRCTRVKCNYLHPPRQLKEQIMMAGKVNMQMRNVVMLGLIPSPLAMTQMQCINTSQYPNGVLFPQFNNNLLYPYTGTPLVAQPLPPTTLLNSGLLSPLGLALQMLPPPLLPTATVIPSATVSPTIEPSLQLAQPRKRSLGDWTDHLPPKRFQATTLPYLNASASFQIQQYNQSVENNYPNYTAATNYVHRPPPPF
ncbi:hypothetical protein L5515_015877 [Caenorhabditis briggsae]|uniref:C3H1-type domain-containing protein n=1 Tax=Caenorhabditis briggsae TaxID=6238 RepID=A0AAE9EIG6_CAEBR|nr:hypothetical protein L5515_015877 [Caenorhabditis briggsae]